MKTAWLINVLAWAAVGGLVQTPVFAQTKPEQSKPNDGYMQKNQKNNNQKNAPKPPASQTGSASKSVVSMPPEACAPTLKGFDVFLKTFAAHEQLQPQYTTAQLLERRWDNLGQSRPAKVDVFPAVWRNNAWVYRDNRTPETQWQSSIPKTTWMSEGKMLRVDVYAPGKAPAVAKKQAAPPNSSVPINRAPPPPVGIQGYIFAHNPTSSGKKCWRLVERWR